MLQLLISLSIRGLRLGNRSPSRYLRQISVHFATPRDTAGLGPCRYRHSTRKKRKKELISLPLIAHHPSHIQATSPAGGVYNPKKKRDPHLTPLPLGVCVIGEASFASVVASNVCIQ